MVSLVVYSFSLKTLSFLGYAWPITILYKFLDHPVKFNENPIGILIKNRLVSLINMREINN